jgi:hypothetical protein
MVDHAASGARRRAARQTLIGIGAVCLIVVVLTHVAERFDIFPAMGWGLPHSPGHYLDLASAILSCVLIPLGFALRLPPSLTGFRRSKRLRQAPDHPLDSPQPRRWPGPHSLPWEVIPMAVDA